MLVDAGNLLFKSGDSGNNPVAMITAHGILRTYSKLSYDAVAVSPQDLQAGADFFKTSKAFGFPWISANIFDEDGQPVFAPSIVIKKDGFHEIGIIGLSGNNRENSFWARIGDWRESLAEQIRQLGSVCAALILLSNLSDDENQEIAKDYPQIDMIIASSPTRRGNQLPVIVGQTLLTQTDGKGKYLGKLELKWHPQGSWLMTSSAETQKHLQGRLATIDLQIQKLKETSDSHPDYERQLTGLLNSRKSLEDHLMSLEATVTEQMQKLVFANTFESTFLPVKPSPSGDEVDSIVQDIKKSTAAYQKVRLQQNGQIDQKTGEALQLSRYAGARVCKDCHEKQSAFWAGTAHARAFATLVNKGQNYNPECLPCHVTGGNISPTSSYAQKDLLLVLPENRQAVGCETCHGPGRAHSLDPENNKLVRKKPAKESCISCHTPEHDGDFEYSIKMSKAACPLGT